MIATIVGGILAAEGRLRTAVTVDEVADVVRGLRESLSLWIPGPYLDERAAELGTTYGLGQRPARWVPPDEELLAHVAEVLVAGWHAAGVAVNAWSPPALRLEVESLDDQDTLRGANAGGLLVVTHTSWGGDDIAWQWPLRVLAAPGLDHLLHGRYRGEHYQLVAEDERADIAVVTPETAWMAAVGATVAVVIDAAGWDPREFPLDDHDHGPAALVLVPGEGSIAELIEEMAHDEPLDVAVALRLPGSYVLAYRDFLSFTSIRMWTGYAGRVLGPPVGDELVRLARTMPFDHEYESSRTLISLLTEQVDPAVLKELSTLSTGPLSTVSFDIEGSIDRFAGARRRARRLQAEVADGDGRLRTDGFVAGQRHKLRVRIAARTRPLTLAADAAFRSPTPGKAVDLTVIARVRESARRPVRRRLRLPATGDTSWTKPISIDVPARAAELTVEIVVLHRGRAVQTAGLTGPVLAAGAAPGSVGLSLGVDADTPTGGLDDRAAAAATLLLSAPQGGEPALIDLSLVGRALPVDELRSANQDVRRILFDAFRNRPANLATAAPVLTKLAVRGSIMYRHLKGKAANFHDDDPWIHVIAFGGLGDLPLELIYTHDMPSDDDCVPVCDSALNGATECSSQCPDKGRADRVCPFAFWATSKVLERRLHVDDRVGATAPITRQIAVTSGAVLGTSVKTDAEDAEASERIENAVKAVVGTDCYTRVSSWSDLREAVYADPAPAMLVLVTHTEAAANSDDRLGVRLELGGTFAAVHRISEMYVNPGGREPGPVVLSLGCDTNDLNIGYSDWVGALHAARAEVVISTLSPVPGKEVADFLERMFQALPAELAGPGPHRCGALLTAVRRATIATGDVLALAITASGDGDIEFVGG